MIYAKESPMACNYCKIRDIIKKVAYLTKDVYVRDVKTYTSFRK